MKTKTLRNLGLGMMVFGLLMILSIILIIPGFCMMVLGGVLYGNARERALAGIV